MSIALFLMAIFSLGVVIYGVYCFAKFVKVVSKNKRPALVFLDASTPVAKAAIKYVEKYVSGAEASITVWSGKNESPGGVIKSENITDEEAMKFLLTAANEIGEGIGIQTAVIRK